MPRSLLLTRVGVRYACGSDSMLTLRCAFALALAGGPRIDRSGGPTVEVTPSPAVGLAGQRLLPFGREPARDEGQVSRTTCRKRLGKLCGLVKDAERRQ